MTENYRRMAQRDLRRVAAAARKLERVNAKARAELRAAILQAREAGETFRDIGNAAGLSHVRVQQIVREGEKGGERG
jgi:DNA-directed RNA polymerase sigma subunit (sigma70/sigma32)